MWCAVECLQKAGLTTGTPLTLVPDSEPDGWVVLDAGGLRVATFVTTVQGLADPVVAAVLAERRRS